MHFTKMQGLGNDYLYIYGPVPADVAQLCVRLCDRHFGPGADGLIFIGPAQTADFSMRIFNADGSEAEMCGNGVRCVGKYVYDRGLTRKTELVVETGAGPRRLRLHPEAGKVVSVTVDMGKAVVRSRAGEGDLVDVGNPHLVCFVPDAEAVPLAERGPALSASVPGGVNVEFVRVLRPERLRLRVWERGSGITPACGTGACAAAAAAVSRGVCAPGRPIAVELDGGVLQITVAADGSVRMEGPAVTVFEGDTGDTEDTGDTGDTGNGSLCELPVSDFGSAPEAHREPSPASAAPEAHREPFPVPAKLRLNENYDRLKPSYLFYRINQRVDALRREHPQERLLLLGVGDVSLPLAPVVIEALHRAADDQSRRETFQGYMPELGKDFMKQAAAAYYAAGGAALDPEEIFISYGAGDDLGSIGALFAPENRVAVVEPAYPAYVDTNLMAGRTIVSVPGGPENGFLPLPSPELAAELVYLCSPNNPTGAAYSRAQLQTWVDWANARGAVILFDAAYEAFITDPDVPHSIYELAGARECAIEIASLSKTAGFTGTRLGWTVVPKALRRGGRSLHAMWVRNRTTCTNGVSYLLQRAGEAALSPEGLRQSRANLAVYRGNGETILRTLDRLGIPYTGGRNAPYVWFRCPNGMESWAFFDWLIDRARIVGTPGEGFGACGEGWFRFSCFGAPDDTAEAMKRLEALL